MKTFLVRHGMNKPRVTNRRSALNDGKSRRDRLSDRLRHTLRGHGVVVLAMLAVVYTGRTASAESIDIPGGNGPAVAAHRMVNLRSDSKHSSSPIAPVVTSLTAFGSGQAWKSRIVPGATIEEILVGSLTGDDATLYTAPFTGPTDKIDHVVLSDDPGTEGTLADRTGLLIGSTTLSGQKPLGMRITEFHYDRSFPTFDVTSLDTASGSEVYVNTVTTDGSIGVQLSTRSREDRIPDPSTLLYLGVGIIGLAGDGWRRSKRA